MFWLVVFGVCHAFAGETILQYFNTSWPELTRRIPELAEAGYTALWLPPPFKAGGGLSVGFDTYDRFDLGSKDQNGSLTTKYGTETELLHLVEMAHRFGLRVYFDNVMAHNGGPMSYGAPGTLQANGFVPEDFHLKRTSETTYENYGWPTWSDEWQVLNRNPFGQDIAQESPNASFGYSEGTTFPKWSGIRHAGRTEIYLDTDLPIEVVSGGVTSIVHTFANKEPFVDANSNGRFDWTDANSNGQHDSGEAGEDFTDTGIDPSRADRQTAAWGYGNGKYDMGNIVAEDVGGMLNRAIRWFVDKASADGFRLDAVKHVPSYFFGKMDDPKDNSNWGYGGQAQEQFNISRGFSDWDNHRDTVFNNVQARDDALLYGEHLGDPPSKDNYVAAGMRIANDDFLNAVKGNIGYTLAGMDNPGYAVISPGQSMHYVMSHDNNYLYGGDREQASAILLTREGLPIVYTDGYNQSGSPDWFPKPAEIPFLGQFGKGYLPNLLDISRHFGWGYQASRWSAWDYLSYTRYDEAIGNNGQGVSMVFAMSKNYGTAWPLVAGGAVFPEGARLFNYSIYNPGKQVKVLGGGLVNMDDDSALYIAPNEYYAFSWRIPGMPAAWGEGLTEEIQPILVYENGAKAGSVTVTRKDGRNGDPAFNPYGLADPNPSDYSYSMAIPRVTQSSNLTFIARADGSAENILMKLDGGIDLNSQMDVVTQDPGTRDNPPAVSKDKFLGYEQMKYVRRVAEKFAAVETLYNTIGSPGAETYACTIGSAGFAINAGGEPNLYDDSRAVTWHFHDPAQSNQISSDLQFNPAPELAASQPVTVWTKIGYAPYADAAWLYYTTNGMDWPEGSAGIGKGATRVAALAYSADGDIHGDRTSQWWSATLPAMPAGTVLRYKIGAAKGDAASYFPWSDADIVLAPRMETLFAITNFNAATIPCYPHNDWGKMATGLDEGLHVLRTKALLGRAAVDTPIYRERTQTFYYDAARPDGIIQYPPADGDTLSGSTYGVKVRTDMSVEEVWYKIEDMEPGNDDSATGLANGNGNNAWVKANKGLVPAPMPGTAPDQQWEFNYVLIPTSGTATITVCLRELSSSTDLALDEADGHFTKLIRTVTTGGNGVHLLVHEPAADGASVGVGSNLVAYFSQTLAAGLDDAELASCFVFDLDGVAQTNGVIQRDATATEHAVRLVLPNLHNGDPGYLHLLSVTFARDGYPTLLAERQVYAANDDDTNDDGIPDSFELQWGLPVGSLNAASNNDTDAYSNLDEYIANTDPTDGNDFLALDSTTSTSNSFALGFTTRSNRNYFVWYSDFMHPDNWLPANPPTDPIEGTGETNQFVDTLVNPTSRFYRLEVKMPGP